MALKSMLALAVFATIAPGVAFAGQAQQQNKTTGPTMTATQMSDADMDKVTAGTAGASLLTVAPTGLLNSPNPPSNPLVFGDGQPTGGSPATQGAGHGVVTFSSLPAVQ